MSSKRALISVTDKTGLIEFAQNLIDLGFEIVSTGGTAKTIIAAGLPCTLVESVTGFPEILDGRVKTLHPKIFAGILADQHNPAHMATLARPDIDIRTFDLVAVNLYEFAKKPSIENIDVGGPSLIRAAAKNYESVIVVVNPDDYHWISTTLKTRGEISERHRQHLATAAFEVTFDYDRMIFNYFAECNREDVKPDRGDKH